MTAEDGIAIATYRIGLTSAYTGYLLYLTMGRKMHTKLCPFTWVSGFPSNNYMVPWSRPSPYPKRHLHLWPTDIQRRTPNTQTQKPRYIHTLSRFSALFPGLPGWAGTSKLQEAQLSPRDRAMRRVSWNLTSCHTTVQKLLVRQVLNKSKLWSWRVTVGRCVINMCTQPWRDLVASIVL